MASPADLELLRVAVVPQGAFGVLLAEGLPIGPVTLERTYPLIETAPSAQQMVKIPTGTYECVRTYFNRGRYYTFEVGGVAGRDRLLFHRGNTETDSDGCILVGQRFADVSGQPGVQLSTFGFADFMKWAGAREAFMLNVRQA